MPAYKARSVLIGIGRSTGAVLIHNARTLKSGAVDHCLGTPCRSEAAKLQSGSTRDVRPCIAHAEMK
jgi:hypothetical protein